jgi:hypothetical protein
MIENPEMWAGYFRNPVSLGKDLDVHLGPLGIDGKIPCPMQ